MNSITNILLIRFILYSCIEAVPKNQRQGDTGKKLAVKNNKTLLDDNTLTVEGLLPSKAEEIHKIDEKNLPGYDWHKYNDSRDEILEQQSKMAQEIQDRYGEKLLTELRTRRSMRPPENEKHGRRQFQMISNILDNVRETFTGPVPRYITHLDASDDSLKYYIIRLMQDAVYQTQERMRALDEVLHRHGHLFHFRISHSFTVIRELIRDIRVISTRLRRDEKTKSKGWVPLLNWASDIRTSTTARHLTYYTHAFVKYIDVVYMIEQICDRFEVHKRGDRKGVKYIPKLIGFYKNQAKEDKMKQQFGK